MKYIFKIVMLGDSGVGKSTLADRVACIDPNNFIIHGGQPTIGVDFKTIEYTRQEYKTKLIIFDLAGQERFKTITISYFKNTHGALICFDLTNRNSFQNVRNWLEELNIYTNDVVKIMVGLKQDLSTERQVSTEEVIEFANQFNLKYIEASSKTGLNVDEMFHQLSDEIYNNLKTQNRLISTDDIVKLNKPLPKKNNCCGI
jgi:Ras-related protein Rab-1A